MLFIVVFLQPPQLRALVTMRASAEVRREGDGRCFIVQPRAECFVSSYVLTYKQKSERKKDKHVRGKRHCAAVLITPNGSIRPSVLIKSRGIPASSAPSTWRDAVPPSPAPPTMAGSLGGGGG